MQQMCKVVNSIQKDKSYICCHVKQIMQLKYLMDTVSPKVLYNCAVFSKISIGDNLCIICM